MDYCGPRGIPRSAFLSWSRQDRDDALWWVIRERQRCPGCGTREDEWNPEQGGDFHAYEAKQVHCPGCQVRAEAEHEFEARGAKPLPGTSIALVRTRGPRG